MGIFSCAKASCGLFFGGLSGALVGGAVGAVAGGSGGLVMHAVNSSYSPVTTLKATAVGSALLLGAAGAAAGMHAFHKSPYKPEGDTTRQSKEISITVPGFIGCVTLGGLLGSALVDLGSMSVGKTTFSAFVGAAVSSVPLSCAAICCCLPCAVAAVWMVKSAVDLLEPDEKQLYIDNGAPPPYRPPGYGTV
jgi:hypothetical protein